MISEIAQFSGQRKMLAFPTSDMVDYNPKMAREVLAVLQHLLEVTVFQLAIQVDGLIMY